MADGIIRAVRPDWIATSLWEAVQLESSTVEAALLVEMLHEATVVNDIGCARVPEYIEVHIDDLWPARDCAFYDLVVAVWLTIRRARMARTAERAVEAMVAISEGAHLLLLANRRPRPSAGYRRAPRARALLSRAVDMPVYIPEQSAP